MTSAETVPQPPARTDTHFVQFWNEVLAPEFIRFKHVLVDGLTQHCKTVFDFLSQTPEGISACGAGGNR